jgi:2-polyprenyl-3-methyl-5-hydroxy-6-metoxy-1,4-benzoquinol methylase
MYEYDYFDSQCTCSSLYILPILKELLVSVPQGSVVVDVGCGNGSVLAGLGRPDWEMHGIEISESGLAHARASTPGIQFHSADLAQEMRRSPIRAHCDVVISTEVIEHVFSPRTFTKNCCNLLKPGGTLIISTPYHGYLKNLVLAASGKLDAHFTALWDQGHIKFWSKRTLAQLLQESGFEIVQFRGAGRLPYLWKSMVFVARKR